MKNVRVFITSFCMLVMLLIWNISVSNASMNNLSYQDFQYTIDEYGEVTIVGYTGMETIVTIPSEIEGMEVVRIGAGAFENNGVMEEIHFNNNLESIGSNAFFNCDSLIHVTVPDSVTVLGSYVFAYSDKLTSVELGNGIRNISEGTFEQCPLLKEVHVSYHLLGIYDRAFSLCSNLQELTLPKNMWQISDSAFDDWTMLTINGVADSYVATLAEQKGSIFVAQNEPATAISFNYTELKLFVDVSYGITDMVRLEPITTQDTYLFESLNPDIFTIEANQFLNTISPGTGTLKISSGSLETTCEITVEESIKQIIFNKQQIVLNKADTFQLETTIFPESIQSKDLIWRSGDSTIATVDAAGKVTATGVGTTIISAEPKSGAPGVIATCQVVVGNDVTYVTGANGFESTHDYSNSVIQTWHYEMDDTTSISFSFDERTYFEPNVDFLYLYDRNNIEIGRYTGDELAGQTIKISGSSVILSLVTNESNTEWGFKVTDISVFPEIAIDNPNYRYVLSGAGAVIMKYTGQEEEIVVPSMLDGNSVTGIDPGAFKDNASIKIVSISDGLDYIADDAFANCTMLEKIIIPNSVGGIGISAFSGSELVTIHAFSSSYAKTYAEGYGIPFESLDKPATGVMFVSNTLELDLGDVYSVQIVVEPNNTTDEILWTSSDESIVWVDNTGKVEAKSYGTAILRVTVGNQVAECRVVVLRPIEPDQPIFSDVVTTGWEHAPIQFVYSHNLMSGVGSGSTGEAVFAPDQSLTREQFAQILYNAEGKPAVTFTDRFLDVPEGQWYSSAIIWAAENNIVSGYNNGKYGVGDVITREQLAVMLYKYADLKGMSTTGVVETVLDSFGDKAEISDWATTQLQWAVHNKVMSGTGVNLEPKGDASRAACAAMLRNYFEGVGK